MSAGADPSPAGEILRWLPSAVRRSGRVWRTAFMVVPFLSCRFIPSLSTSRTSSSSSLGKYTVPCIHQVSLMCHWLRQLFLLAPIPSTHLLSWLSLSFLTFRQPLPGTPPLSSYLAHASLISLRILKCLPSPGEPKCQLLAQPRWSVNESV